MPARSKLITQYYQTRRRARYGSRRRKYSRRRPYTKKRRTYGRRRRMYRRSQKHKYFAKRAISGVRHLFLRSRELEVSKDLAANTWATFEVKFDNTTVQLPNQAAELTPYKTLYGLWKIKKVTCTFWLDTTANYTTDDDDSVITMRSVFIPNAESIPASGKSSAGKNQFDAMQGCKIKMMQPYKTYKTTIYPKVELETEQGNTLDPQYRAGWMKTEELGGTSVGIWSGQQYVRFDGLKGGQGAPASSKVRFRYNYHYMFKEMKNSSSLIA